MQTTEIKLQTTETGQQQALWRDVNPGQEVDANITEIQKDKIKTLESIGRGHFNFKKQVTERWEIKEFITGE